MNRRVWVAAAKAGSSLALVAALVAAIDFGHFKLTVGRIGVPSLAAAAGLLWVQATLVALRWRAIVGRLGLNLPWVCGLRWVFLGMFFNQVLPTSIGGDAVRIWKLHRQGAAPGVALASVAIERISGVALLGLLISASMVAAWHSIEPGLRIVLISTGPLLLVLLAALAWVDVGRLRIVPKRLLVAIAVTSHGLRDIGTSRSAVATIACLGLAASVAGIGAACVLGHDIGIDLPFSAFAIAVGGAALLSILPISLGGWGVREAGMVALLGAQGVATEPALALSLIYGMLQLLVSLPGGLMWWGDRWADVGIGAIGSERHRSDQSRAPSS